MKDSPLIPPKSIYASHVPLHVEGQVVRPGERALAQVALERTVARVFAEMASQFVGASEFPTATLPAAMVRLLTCVSSVMRLQMRALGVRFPAAGEGAGVRRRALPRPGAPSSLGLGLE